MVKNKRKLSLYDLAFYYTKEFYQDSASKDDKRNAIVELANLLDRGWPSEEICNRIKQFKYNNPNKLMNLKTHFNGLKPFKQNLLETNRFYYHNALRVSPRPPVIDFDYNTGEVKRLVEDYYLEMRASFTAEDLCDYFLSKSCLYEKGVTNAKRLTGSLRWLTKQFDIDLLLFMFDVANDTILTCDFNKLKTPMDVQYYYAEAVELYQKKITQTRMTGGDSIVPRQRVLSS